LIGWVNANIPEEKRASVLSGGYIAKIGDAGYYDMKDAIAAVKNNETIVLIGSGEITLGSGSEYSLSEKSGVVLDIGSAALTLGGANQLDNFSQIKIGSGKLNVGFNSILKTVTAAENAGAVINANSGSLKGNFSGYAGKIVVNNGGSFTVNSDTGLKSGVLDLEGGNIIINGTIFTLKDGG